VRCRAEANDRCGITPLPGDQRRLGQSLGWAAWAHRDTDEPPAHLILRYDGDRQQEQLQREIEAAARGCYREIREQQREYAKEQARLARERGRR
jgi:hypothetical protein